MIRLCLVEDRKMQNALPGTNQKWYHQLYRNCNHFANDLCERLTGKPAPEWVNRLAWIADKAKFLLPPGLESLNESPVTDPANQNSAPISADTRTNRQDSDPDSDD